MEARNNAPKSKIKKPKPMVKINKMSLPCFCKHNGEPSCLIYYASIIGKMERNFPGVTGQEGMSSNQE